MENAADSPRKACPDCVRKHLAQAIVLFQEAMQGYPEHRWLAMGHMAEAEAEIEGMFPDIADEIRGLRKKCEEMPGFYPGLIRVIKEITDRVESSGDSCPCMKKADFSMVAEKLTGKRIARVAVAERVARKFVSGFGKTAFLGHDALDDGGVDEVLKKAGWEMKRAGYNYRICHRKPDGQLEIRITAVGPLTKDIEWFVKLEDEEIGRGQVARSGDAVPTIIKMVKGL